MISDLCISSLPLSLSLAVSGFWVEINDNLTGSVTMSYNSGDLGCTGGWGALGVTMYTVSIIVLWAVWLCIAGASPKVAPLRPQKFISFGEAVSEACRASRYCFDTPSEVTLSSQIQVNRINIFKFMRCGV